MSRLPDEVISIFEKQREVNVRPTMNDSIELHSATDSNAVDAEFVRAVGLRVVKETGYIISGMRDYSDGYIEIWLDELPSSVGAENLTVAQRAARCLDHKENGTCFEPNISDEPKEQYVDVYPEPHESACEDYSLKSDDMDRLREEGLQIRCMSCGRERGTYNNENYRIWFEPVDE